MSDLRTKAIAGAGWTLGSAVILRLAQMIVTIVLARLLMPKDFGLFALGVMVVNAVNMFRDYGLAQSLIYENEKVGRSADATFWMSSAFGAASWIGIYLLSPHIAGIFDKESLVALLRVMSFSVIITSLAMVPSALLEKELMFRRRALPEIANALVYASVSIGLAFDGQGVWSLVYGHVAGAAAWSVAALWASGWRPGLSFHPESAKKSLSYGRHLMLASVLVFAFFYIDHAAIGKFLGVTALGLYSLAFTVCNLPATNITHVVNKVMFPTYTKLNNDMEAMGNAYLQTIRSISVLSFPLAIGLCTFAGDFVPVVFGHKWLASIPLFRILAFYGLYRSIGATCGSVFMASGQPKWVLRTNLIMVILALTFLYPVVTRYGVVGVSLLFTGAYMVGTSVAICKVMRMLSLGVRDYVHALRGSFIAAASSAAVGCILADVVFGPGAFRFLLGACVMTALYTWIILVTDQSTAGVAKDIMGTILHRRARANA